MASALAMTGKAQPWSVRKGAIHWLASRREDGLTPQLRAILSPDLLD
jgi:hypothetical protein